MTLNRRGIAAVEMIGGVIGLAIGLWFAPQVLARTYMPVLTFVEALAIPFLLSTVAGILLWRGTLVGDVLSFLNLSLQIPVISTSLVGYYYTCAVGLRVGLTPTGPFYFIFFGSEFHWSIAEHAPGPTWGVNLVGIVLLTLLIRSTPPHTPLPVATDVGVPAP